ncbi:MULTISPECIES: hypothetical protein [unclassified Pseudomonas]|jgi:hypothetical protein|uniref:hypothetical protein n=1 Tax=unclassified Pseudomonas TaxID=196821 RepID=UPI00069D0EDA|nr:MULTISPECIES: hypothetical protein [unclassified Pseudomonas]WPN49379.1 hypothetical protein QMK58_12250 [Pseudomonas sp. P8_241]
MTRSGANAVWCLAFLFVGLLGVGLGRLSAEHATGRDFWCEGESAHQTHSEARPGWLTIRYRLDLQRTGLSHMRMVAKLIDANTGTELGTARRNSAFEVQQQGHRLQVNVVSAAQGEADSTSPELTSTLGLFIFRPNSNLSYWIRPLTESRYLIDDGNDMFILCSRR